MLRVSFTVILIFLFASCHDFKKREQLVAVGDMISTSDSIQRVLETYSPDSARKIASNVTAVLLAIRENYHNDTLSLETGKRLDAYKMVLTDLKNARKIHAQIQDGITEEKPLLIKLQQDISTGAGDRSRYAEYISFEKNKITQLNVLLKSWQEILDRYTDTYKDLHEEMKQLGTTGNFNS